MKDLIPIEAIQERDIDLLLLEELYCSFKFREWFIEKTIGKNKSFIKFLGIWHSLNKANLGESDLVMKFLRKDNKAHLFLIENKIDASFQPAQPLRYKQRGEKYIKEGECVSYSTVLIAPKKYIRDNEDFDFVIEYEQIRDWFNNQAPQDKRAEYKAKIFSLAIEKSRRGYRPIPDEKATNFWHAYWQISKEIAPELGLKEPKKDIPAGSTFIIFKPKVLPKDISLVHKIDRGFIDLEFRNKGSQIEAFKEKYQQFLEEGMIIERAHKSAVIRVFTEVLSFDKDFDKQRQSVIDGIKKAKNLLQWFVKNKEAF